MTQKECIEHIYQVETRFSELHKFGWRKAVYLTCSECPFKSFLGHSLSPWEKYKRRRNRKRR